LGRLEADGEIRLSPGDSTFPLIYIRVAAGFHGFEEPNKWQFSLSEKYFATSLGPQVSKYLAAALGRRNGTT
jgi:hypothetical protein